VITVSEAARVVGRDAETVRRWIRQGKLRAFHDGPRLLVLRDELASLTVPTSLPLPEAWRQTASGPQPDWVAWLRRSRRGIR